MSIFRDPDLTNERALDEMGAACRKMTNAAVEARCHLLSVGFGDGHSMCRELDDVARRWAVNLAVVQREQS